VSDTCANCRFYGTARIEGGIGRCRRRAPRSSEWPGVRETDWCGEHEVVGASPAPLTTIPFTQIAPPNAGQFITALPVPGPALAFAPVTLQDSCPNALNGNHTVVRDAGGANVCADCGAV